MPQSSESGVAVVGMACVFPGAGDLGAYWRNLREGVDAITRVPADRWDPRFYDPDSDAVDRIYCRRGGFVDDYARVDPLDWGLMPVSVEGGEPDQMLVLEAAGRALADAGYRPEEIPGSRTGIALGRGGYMSAGIRRYSRAAVHAQELIDCLRELVPDVGPEELDRVKEEYVEGLPAMEGGTVIGLVPNLAASRVANRMDLQGPAYTLDAACASSLLAVDQACAELERGRCDLMLAGGVHLGMGPGFWSVFCQLGALSPSGTIRPFDRDADGLLIGEGVGLVVLKRLEDARRDGDRVYAAIRGTGVSSDGRRSSLMNPRPDGQSLAVRRAWEAAGLDPRAPGALGLLEAHGTGTSAGDGAEIQTLREVFGPADGEGSPVGMGSVKSMIGHTMPAAGAAGMIKAVLALHHRTLLPTLHCDEPRPELAETRFRVVDEAEPWEGGEGPRRAGVNAFGFGGINAHVILEEVPSRREAQSGARRTAAVGRTSGPARPSALLLTADRPADLLEGLEAERSRTAGGDHRLAVLEPTAERLERARKVVENGKPFRDRKGHVWYAPEGGLAREGRIAFLYPGLDAGAPEGADAVASAFGRGPLPRFDPTDREELGAAIVYAGKLLTEVLEELGVEPDVVAGHSIGEWTAMIAAGSLRWETVEEVLREVGPDQLTFPDVDFASVGAGAGRIEETLSDLPDVDLALDNCPHQTVICGKSDRLGEALDRLRGEGVLCQRLDFRSGFHSRHFEPFLDPVREHVGRIEFHPPQRPLWSASTCAPFPEEPDRIRELFLEHLVRPVRFRETVERLHEAGVRVFVQMGPGSLVGFVDDTLRERSHAALRGLDPGSGGIEQLRRLVTALWVEGLEVELDRLVEPLDPEPTGRAALELDLSTPRIGVSTPLRGVERPDEPTPVPDGPIDDPVVREYRALHRTLRESSREVFGAWDRRAGAGAGARGAPSDTGDAPRREELSPRSRTFTRRLSLESDPELLDHSLVPIPEDWPRPEDGFPVVPMTMSWSMMMEAARELVPERTVVGLEDVRAFRWISLDEPLELEIEASFDGQERVEVRLGPYLRGTVRLAETYPEPPEPRGGPFPDEERPSETAREIYDRRIMFHGPAYRSIRELTGWSDRGVRGRVEALPAEGSLLDGCGQVLGFWIRKSTERDRLAFPVMMDGLTLYGPEPPVGSVVDCKVWIRHFGRSQVRADLEVRHRGEVWARCEGWQDRRFENEPWMWPSIARPEENLAAEPFEPAPSLCWLRRPIEARQTQYGYCRRYMGQSGYRTFEDMEDQREQEDWLAGRIAAKDAVRHWLWGRGHGPVFPMEIGIEADSRGAPLVECPYADDLHVSIAHRDGRAAAIVAQGRAVGVDLERIEAREEGFEAVAFTDEERELMPREDRDEWRTRFWAAKEALAKRRRTGLEGAPRSIPVERVEGERLRCDGEWVETRAVDGWVLAWTRSEDGGADR